MAQAQERLGGGTKARPRKETIADTGPERPDGAVGPEDRTIPDQLQLFDDAESRAVARKLRAELDALASDEEAALADPTGHA